MRSEIGVKNGLGITATELGDCTSLAPVDEDVAVRENLRVAL